MRIPGARTARKWAHSYLDGPTLLWRWLLLYGVMVTLGVLGDVTGCKLTPLPTIWAQLLPELHYVGIVFAATRFGVGFGLAAGCFAGLLHIAAVAMTCSEPNSQ